MHRISRSLAFVICVLLTLTTEANNEFTTITFSKTLGGTEESTFFCNEKIWSRIVVRDITQDEMHSLKVIWRDPSGSDQEVIEEQLSADSAGEIVQYIWLKLHRPKGSAFFSLFEDTYGMTNFIGDWNLLVFVDGTEWGRKTFNVHC